MKSNFQQLLKINAIYECNPEFSCLILNSSTVGSKGSLCKFLAITQAFNFCKDTNNN